MNSKRIYLDNAATTWPKPDSVYTAVDQYLRENGAPAGRGTYREAEFVERQIAACRSHVARLIGAKNPSQIVFTENCTNSLNMAIHGILENGDHVVTTVIEHNSVLRPLHELEKQNFIKVTYVQCDQESFVSPQEIEKAINPSTKMVILNHVSNVTGSIQSIEEVGKIASSRELIFLVDAAQSLGSIPIDVNAANISILAASGHKGLFGILGSGVLFVDERTTDLINPIIQGGTGTQSDDVNHPTTMPEKLESGNRNVPAILGLLEGLKFIESTSTEAIGKQINKHVSETQRHLLQIDGITIFGSTDRTNSSGIICFSHEKIDPRTFSTMLESGFRIQTRAGFHCAPLIHKALNTGTHGAVRISPGYFTTADEIGITVEAISQIAESKSHFA